VPVSGTAPVLRSGLVYDFFAETTGASGAEGFFYMDGTTPVLTNVPGLCESAFVGDMKQVKCGTNEPYIEPIGKHSTHSNDKVAVETSPLHSLTPIPIPRTIPLPSSAITFTNPCAPSR
jgi:hypothetical protein